MTGYRWLLILCVLAASGCEKPPPRVTRPATTAAVEDVASASPPSPTTQELMNGAYKTVSLSPLPLNAKVPESWDCKTLKGTEMSFLEGPGPDGIDVRISLETSPPTNLTNLELLLDSAKKDAAKDKKTILLCDVRDAKGIKVLEIQNLLASTTQQGQINVDWNTTFFVPKDIDYVGYVLNVYIPVSQFDQTKELIQKILDSVTYQPPSNGL